MKYSLLCVKNLTSLLKSCYYVNVFSYFSSFDQRNYTFVQILCFYDIFVSKRIEPYLSRQYVRLFFYKLRLNKSFCSNRSPFRQHVHILLHQRLRCWFFEIVNFLLHILWNLRHETKPTADRLLAIVHFWIFFFGYYSFW